jgi:hypothetical protein
MARSVGLGAWGEERGAMARRPTDTEFPSKLKELSGIRTQTELARVCGTKVGDMNQYLNGNFVPGN